jgi:hypothetical protein
VAFHKTRGSRYDPAEPRHPPGRLFQPAKTKLILRGNAHFANPFFTKNVNLAQWLDLKKDTGKRQELGIRGGQLRKKD